MLHRLARFFDVIGCAYVERIGERARSTVDILLIEGLLLADLWLLNPAECKTASTIVYAILIILAIAVFRRIRMTPEYSDRSRQPGPVLLAGIVAVITLGGIGLVVTGAHVAGVLETHLTWASFGKPPDRFPSWVIGKAGTVVAQQIGLQLLLFPLCLRIARRRASAALIGAGLFGLLHAPNPLLMIGTFLVAPIWFWSYAYGHRIVPLVLSHLILAAFVRFALPSHIHLDLRVGGRAVPQVEELIWLNEQGLWSRVNHYSSETYFSNQGGNAHEYIHGCYRDILGRNELEIENDHMVSLLRFQTRKEIVIDLFTQAEFLEKHHLPSPYGRYFPFVKVKRAIRAVKTD
jgi:hypothetical protein